MKPLSRIILTVLAFAVIGCAHVSVVAPPGQTVYLASSVDKTQVQRRWHSWYLTWGLTPFNNAMPAEYIQREQLTEVRIIVEDNIPDALNAILYNVVMPFGLVPQTIIMQGNRPPSHVTSPAAQ